MISSNIRGNRHLHYMRPMTDMEQRRFSEIRLYYYLKAIHEALAGSYITGQFLECLCLASDTPRELIGKYYDELRRGIGRPTLNERILYGTYLNLSYYKINTMLRVRYEAIDPFMQEYLKEEREFVITLLTEDDAKRLDNFCDMTKTLLTSIDLKF